MTKHSRRSARRGGVQDPEYEEGEVIGPRLPPPPPATPTPGLSNEPGGTLAEANTRRTQGQGRHKSRKGSRKSRKARRISRRR